MSLRDPRPIRKRSLCRPYVYSRMQNQALRCNKGDQCRFYHPSEIDSNVQQEYNREIGRCYCGASLRTLRNNRPLSPDDDEAKPFFVVCSRTWKGISRCKK